MDGAFDLFHVGHINLLEKSRQLGDFVLVGVLDDEVILHTHKGEGARGERERAE